METNRRAEKRGKVLASLRAEFQALGVQNPILPTDLHSPKRKFEREMFEARQSLRQLQSLFFWFRFTTTEFPIDQFEWSAAVTDPAMLQGTSVNLAEVWDLPTWCDGLTTLQN